MTNEDTTKRLNEALERLTSYEHTINALEDDAISRQAVLDAIEDDNRNGHYSCFASNNDAQCFKGVIGELPSVNPQEPKTGHWIEHSEIETSTPEYLMFYECSECGNKQCFYKADTHRRNYCGKCGAKMIDHQESEG